MTENIPSSAPDQEAPAQSENIFDTLAGIAVQQIRAGLRDKQNRVKEIKKNDDAYNNVALAPADGRFNVPIPVMGGFIDTLTSKLNDEILIKYNKQEEADLKKAKMVTAKWEHEAGPDRGKWKLKDIINKRNAGISGVAIFEKHAETVKVKGKDMFKDVLRTVHWKHFYCEPKKGHDLELHNFVGEGNVWRTKSQLEKGNYNQEQVKRILAHKSDSDAGQDNEDIIMGESKQYKSLTTEDKENYTGEPLYHFFNHYMEYEGKRYYLLVDYQTGIWVRGEELEDMFSLPDGFDKIFWPYRAWHTHPSTEKFWTKAPADDVRPIHETIRIITNLALENLLKLVRAKRAIDPDFFPDPSEIENVLNEVVEAESIPGRSIGEGIYDFQTKDSTSIVVNLTQFLNGMLGEKTGITAGAQGNADEDTATVYVGNLEQVANRMNLYSDFYRQCWAELGQLFFIGLKDHLTPEQYVRVMGANGYEWEELVDDHLHPIRMFDVSITGGSKESELSIVKNRDRKESLQFAVEQYKAFMNPQWVIENTLKMGQWEDEDVKSAVDLDLHGSKELLSECAQAIQDIRAGKGSQVKPNRKANEAFIMKILDHADDHADSMTDQTYEELYAYAFLHAQIVADNKMRDLAVFMRTQPNLPTPGGAQEAQLPGQTNQEPGSIVPGPAPINQNVPQPQPAPPQQ